MDLEQLKREWVKHGGENSDLQAKIWDGRAEDYGKWPLPSRDSNFFLNQVFEKAKPDKTISVLDIGCGTGRFAVALADEVKEVVGIDVSPKMIELARKLAEERQLSNVQFFAGDWSSWNIEQAGFKGRFDLVFAHMSPAVCDYQTLNQMNGCAKGHCFLVKPSRRRDSIQDAAFEKIGITGQKNQYDDTISNTFIYLWHKGYRPDISYRDEVWEKKMTEEEMCAWCVNRAKLQTEISTEQEEEICRYIREKSVDGTIKETTTTTIVTIYWHV